MPVENNVNTPFVSAGIGTAVGAATGAAVGITRANSFVKGQGATLDEFIKNGTAQVRDTVKMLQETKKSNITTIEAVRNFRDKAPELYNNMLKDAKKSKIKWIAGLAAAGLAVGAAVGLVAKNNQDIK